MFLSFLLPSNKNLHWEMENFSHDLSNFMNQNMYNRVPLWGQDSSENEILSLYPG